jgi:YD repeat-containing protein
VSYAYDADGNITQAICPSGGIVTFSRELLGRISGVTTKKDSGSATVTLGFGVTYQPFGPLASLTYGNDLPLAVDVDTMSPNLYFVHADQLDRPVKMTDGSKAVVWDATYRPFGEAHSITGSAANNLRFPGQYYLIEPQPKLCL